MTMAGYGRGKTLTDTGYLFAKDNIRYLVCIDTAVRFRIANAQIAQFPHPTKKVARRFLHAFRFVNQGSHLFPAKAPDLIPEDVMLIF